MALDQLAHRAARLAQATRGVSGFMGALRDGVTRALPTELRGNDTFTTHLPASVVDQKGPVQLLKFSAAPGKQGSGAGDRAPILFVYSLINRYYILDFMPGRSLLEFYTQQGRDCYVIDWGTPTLEDRYKTWEDYAVRYIRFAIEALRSDAGLAPVEPVHLFGYCVGGTLSMTFSALRPSWVRTLTLMATPVDFHDEGLLRRWTDPERFDVDEVVAAFGHVPTWLLESGFRMLSPLSNLTKWRDLWRGRDREGFIEVWRRMEQWASDNVPFPAEVYRQYIRDTYQTNAFCRGEMMVGGERLDLTQISAPVLAVVALRDQIVPIKSATAIEALLPEGQVRTLSLDTGHLGLSTSGKASAQFWPKMHDWLLSQEGQQEQLT